MNGSKQSASDEHGITDADRAQIEAYLRKPAHARSVDDLRRRQDS